MSSADQPPPIDATDEALLEVVRQRFLADFDAQIERVVAELRQLIIEYQAVPHSEVRTSTLAIVSTVLSLIPAQRIDVADLAPLGELARRRAEQGFPPEALTRSIQLGSRLVLEEIDRLAAEVGVGTAMMLDVHDATWQFATDAAAVIATINHEIAVDIGQRESGHRADFLRAVLRGALPPQQITVEARNFGLDPAVRYHPLRARPTDRRDEDRVSLLIRRTSTTHAHRPLLAVVDGDLVGLVPQRPTVGDQPMLIALGDAAPITMVAESFRAASLALDAAQAFGRTGVVTLEDLGPLPLTLLGEDLAEVMQRHHFSQLDGDAAAGKDVTQTVWTWLRCDQNVDETARQLHIHRNTVRYRMSRFKELTALDVRRTDDLIIAWWILGRRAAKGLL